MNTLLRIGAFNAVLVLAYIIGCLALGGWLASKKGYSVNSWLILLLFFGVLALLVLVGAPDKKTQNLTEKQNELLEKLSMWNTISDPDKKSSFKENINNEAYICPHCGENLAVYENGKKTSQEEVIILKKPEAKDRRSNNEIRLLDDVLLRNTKADLSSSVCKLQKGIFLKIKDDNSDPNWIYVETSDGKNGWILKKYLDV